MQSWLMLLSLGNAANKVLIRFKIKQENLLGKEGLNHYINKLQRAEERENGCFFLMWYPERLLHDGLSMVARSCFLPFLHRYIRKDKNTATLN